MPRSNKVGRKIFAMPRLFWAGLIMLAAAGAAAFLMFRPAEVTHQNSGRPLAAAAQGLAPQNSAEFDQDDDNDGLKNWEEALWGTDPKNSDTDNDGTPDGAETRESRDPTKPGPNDRATPLAERLAGERTAGSSGNLTAQFLGSLGGALDPSLLARIRDGSAGPEDLQALARALPAVQKLDPKKVLASREVSRRDLTLSTNSDRASVKKYFNDVAAIYAATFPSFSRDAAGKLIPSLQATNGADANSPEEVVIVLDAAFRKIKELPTPRGFEDFAVSELNYLLSLKRITEVLKNAENDPLAGIVAVTELQAQTKRIQDFRRKTLAELLTQSITFGADDGAYALLNQ